MGIDSRRHLRQRNYLDFALSETSSYLSAIYNIKIALLISQVVLYDTSLSVDKEYILALDAIDHNFVRAVSIAVCRFRIFIFSEINCHAATSLKTSCPGKPAALRRS